MYFKILKSKNNVNFYFVGYGNNHEPIFTSEMYTTKQSAKHTIEIIKAQALEAPIKDESDN
ncbi:MAG: YegP family protein [Cetobacterium sp.]|uniref:YegP family protein n=1 Tax=Cetobacterium sp. TaxID=2071632 RepID=UPI0025C699FF|nr:YegP family protein [Cetobacterium sp.]